MLILPKGTTSNLHFFITKLKHHAKIYLFSNKKKCYKILFASLQARAKMKFLHLLPLVGAREGPLLQDGKEPQFSREKLFKWFTFLPFETPTTLFLPKIGTVLLYSSSFSMINVL